MTIHFALAFASKIVHFRVKNAHQVFNLIRIFSLNWSFLLTKSRYKTKCHQPLEIEKSFNDQIDLFTGIRNFEKIAEMCNIVTNNLQSNMHFKALVERAQKIESQI